MSLPNITRASWAAVRDRHHEAVRMIFMGIPQKEIAQKLGYTDQRIAGIKHRPEVRELLDSMQDRADDAVIGMSTRIRELVPKALDLYTKILEKSESDDIKFLNLQARISESVLDRGGLPKQKDISISHKDTVGSIDLVEAKKLAIEAAKAAGIFFVDVEAESISESPSDIALPLCDTPEYDAMRLAPKDTQESEDWELNASCKYNEQRD